MRHRISRDDKKLGTDEPLDGVWFGTPDVPVITQDDQTPMR
jgi:hypothetical protein